MENEYRKEWMRVLTGALAEELRGSSGRKPVIGIIGALGAHDVGDEAMLTALITDLREWNPEVEFKVFSMKPEITESYIHLPTAPDLHIWAFNRKSPLSIACYAIDRVEDACARAAKKLFRLDETWCGGWFLRGVYSLLAMRLRGLARRQRSGKQIDRLSPLTRHIANLSSLDALIVLGGGYINSWHVKARSYLFAATFDAAADLGVPVFGTGMNLGPFNSCDVRRLGRTFGRFKLIGMRDRRESFDELRKMGVFDQNIHMFSSDDAVTLEASALGDEQLEAFVTDLGPYIAVQAHTWLMGESACDELLRRLAETVDTLVERRGCRVLMIPMTFGQGNPTNDYAVLQRMKSLCRCAEQIACAPDDLDPRQLKYLFAHASAAIVTRHHAMVFSISEGTPCAAIILDPYYKMKLYGVSEDYSDICTLVPVENATPEVLLEHVEAHLVRS